mmetsp:Transcript_31084/g.69980  ORF Transcript_31084/g.69980 Transcript_31084/m.69980 type:complete len:128 (+) Transcript_31084:551-934(+)
MHFWQVTRSQQSQCTKKFSESLQHSVNSSLKICHLINSHLHDKHLEMAHLLHVAMSSQRTQAYFLHCSQRALWNRPSFCFLMLNLHLTRFWIGIPYPRKVQDSTSVLSAALPVLQLVSLCHSIDVSC